MARSKSRGRGFRRERKSWLGLWTAAALVVLLASFAGVIASSRPSVGGDRLRIDVFVDAAGRNRIKDARILEQDSFVTGTYVRPDGRLGTYSAPYLRISDRSSLLALLLENRIPTDIDQQLTKRLLDPAALLIPPMILAVLIIYLFMSYRRRSGLFGIRSGARRADPKQSTVTFADVAGQDAAVTELMEVKEFLSDPDRFTGVGAVVPKGILLFGPPGCGKTLLARALAAEAGAAFYSISGSDFVEVYVGVGAARMRDLFKEARDNAPAILFIDELDSVGRRRKGGAARTGADEEQEQALNQILAELDGFSPLQGIIVVGATNRPDVLDPALLRPGRFDRTIGLERPDEPARRAILAVHVRNKRLAEDVDLARVASRAIGLSGADLASVMNEGALLAARAGKPEISQLELDTALERILGAPERQRRLSMRDRGFGRTMGGEHRVTFDDVAGLDEAIAELAEVRDYLAEPERYVEMGARPPRGFLLVGPPGCGKTLLARAVAVEANAAFFSVAATQFVESLAGEGAARVRDLFAEAKAAAPSIVFIDEVDAIGARRGLAGAYRETEQTLNQILIELDGFDARSGVMVMAASNRPEILDEALVRPGRFDRTVSISLPDRAGRRAILDVHAKSKPLASDVDLDAVALLTQAFSGADLANVMNESALLATRRRLNAIPMSAVDEAVDRVGIGIARAQRLVGDEIAMVAYHEAGHALVTRALPGASPPHKISIVSRGRSLGSTWTIDRTDRSVYSRSFLLDRMAGMLGGRAAEELVFGEPGSGAADDLHRVSDLARRMVSDYGMSEEVGPFTYADAGGRNERPPGYSEESDRRVDSEARRLVATAFERARAVLIADRVALDRLAEALLDQETILDHEIDSLVGPPQQVRT